MQKRKREGKAMLRIYYGDMQDVIYNTSVYFK